MKKYLLLILCILLLSSCSNTSLSFNKNDLEPFLTSLNENNFTVEATYDELYNGEVINTVKYTFKVNNDKMYREMKTYQKGFKEPSVITYVYTYIKDGEYIDYLYQEDSMGVGPQKTYVKETINEQLYLKELAYGKSFIFDELLTYKYNQEKEYFYAHTFTIKLNNKEVVVTNQENNMHATYSKIGATSIKVPNFVKEYKKDIIIR